MFVSALEELRMLDCKRRSVLVMPSVFFSLFLPSFLLSVHASFRWCQVNGGTAERIFLFKILDIDSRGVHALCEDSRNDDDGFRLAKYGDKQISCEKADKITYGLSTNECEFVMIFVRWRQ